ncbi:hypothetical protein MMC18_002142 [Xylographa bjoerkii]|nr:hypothetical protein [Xylographa bjoerkii]
MVKYGSTLEALLCQSLTQIADLNLLEVYLKRMMKLVPRDGRTVDLMPLFKRLFIDKGTSFIFGQSVNTFCPADAHPDVEAFLTLFEDALRGMGARLRLSHLRILRGRDQKWKKSCKEFHLTVDRFVDQAVERQSQSSETRNGKHTYVLVDRLLQASQDRDEIRTTLINVFLAGRDQIGITISHIFFILARHSRVWNKLRDEALALTQPVTYELLKSFKYLQYILFILAIRLHSPVGRSIRHCISDCILPNGRGPDGKAPVLVRRGMQIEMDFSAMHHDPSIGGENSEEFIPERWEGLKPGWEYIPFLGGGRVCPAKEMALTQCGYVLVPMMQEFQTSEKRDDEWEFVEDLRNAKQIRNGVLVAMVPAAVSVAHGHSLLLVGAQLIRCLLYRDRGFLGYLFTRALAILVFLGFTRILAVVDQSHHVHIVRSSLVPILGMSNHMARRLSVATTTRQCLPALTHHGRIKGFVIYCGHFRIIGIAVLSPGTDDGVRGR